MKGYICSIGAVILPFFTNLMILTLPSVPQDPRVENRKEKVFSSVNFCKFFAFFPKSGFFTKISISISKYTIVIEDISW